MYILKPLTLAVLSAISQAVTLKIYLDAPNGSTGPTNATMTIEDDSTDISGSPCGDDVPDYYSDPVCYEGMWLEAEELLSPGFMACGPEPENILYPVCNTTTG